MEFKKVDLNNKKIFQDTYIKALTEGFIGFVPLNFIKEFDKTFDTYFYECFNDKNTEMWICFEEEKPIGVIVFGKSNLDNAQKQDAFLDSIYLRKNAHGKGYGKIALDFLENRLKEKGYKKIYLWCSIENQRAWKFYKKNKYIPTQQKWDDELDGKIFHNILFYKEL